MLIHIRLLKCNDDYDDWDYDKSVLLSAYKIKSYDRFIRFIQSLKKHHKDIIIKDDWYTVEDYALHFPESKDEVPCLYIYVSGY